MSEGCVKVEPQEMNLSDNETPNSDMEIDKVEEEQSVEQLV